jgi:hypothetical protein
MQRWYRVLPSDTQVTGERQQPLNKARAARTKEKEETLRLKQLVRALCLGNRKSLCDQRLDLLLLKEVKQGDQILSKEFRFKPFERLNAVGDHPFPAREKPAAGDAQSEEGGSTKSLTTTRATGSQSLPT